MSSVFHVEKRSRRRSRCMLERCMATARRRRPPPSNNEQQQYRRLLRLLSLLLPPATFLSQQLRLPVRHNHVMECFHLAYFPATNIEPSVDVTITVSDVDWEISLRSASSLRLYRCHGLHPRRTDDTAQADYPLEESTASIDEQCSCCCCRVERCSPDPLVPQRSSAESVASRANKNEFEDNTALGNVDNNLSSKEPALLAVLVPSSLTQCIIELLNTTNTLERQNGDNEIINSEEELRVSIHPCLCIHKPRVDSHLDNHESLNDWQGNNIDENVLSPQIRVRGIITSHYSSNCANFPADVVLLSAMLPSESCTKSGQSECFDRMQIFSHLSNLLNHDTASNAPWSILKAFPISSISRLPSPVDLSRKISSTDEEDLAFDIAALPCCTVCLNLIEPTRLGLPELKPHHKCSKWCLSANDVQDDHTYNRTYSQRHTCANEMNFIPSPQCSACQAIFQRELPNESIPNGSCEQFSFESPLMLSHAPSRHDQLAIRRDPYPSAPSSSCNSCHQCGMTSNLWVCLSCGVVGCGRYTRRHAEEHYTFMRHPYSYELATGRIWDYNIGKFVHRIDLTECPVLAMRLGRVVACAKSQDYSSPLVNNSFAGQGGGFLSESPRYDRWNKENCGGGLDILGDSITQCHSNLEVNQNTQAHAKMSAPKKSIMISEEYEALLQSALEDQAQHYQGEISRLRAQSATARMQESVISERESREIDALRMDSERLKHDLEKLSSALLEDQRTEAKYRSLSQRLLREQSISKELLENIRNKTAAVLDQGKQRVDDLEMQIADLDANLRMISQFAANKELNQAQICGTVGGVAAAERKGKKQRGKQDRRERKRG